MESEQPVISKDDQRFIDEAPDEPSKLLREEVIKRAIELNGAVEVAQPGMAVSYINRENYVRLVSIDGMADRATATLEQALNWEALGRGKGGLAGAAVRHKLRELFDLKRECLVVDKFDKTWITLMKEYSEYAASNKFFFATWHANAWNVLGLATSSFIRECHHWNAQNTRPIKALCGSLNMEQELPENEYRKAFYLSIHPVPLIYLTATYLKAKNLTDLDISETVRQRLNVPPAGYADFCACGVAAQAFLTEKYAGHAVLIGDIKKVYKKTNELRSAPLGYNQFAVQLGVTKKEFNKTRYTEAMIVLAAYAKSQIGGTLAKSPALNKFIEANQRKVNKFIDAFEFYAQQKSDDLFALITGKGVSAIDDLPAKLKPLIRVQGQLAGVEDQGIVQSVSHMVQKRIDLILRETEEFEAKPVDVKEVDETEYTLDIVDPKLRSFVGLSSEIDSTKKPDVKLPEITITTTTTED